MAQTNIDDTVTRYENFINEVLKEDLRELETKLEFFNNEVSDLIQQKHTLKVLTNKNIHPTGFKTQVNVGCNFFMEASVSKTDTLLVNIGLNHYIEFKLSEANRFLEARIKYYEKKSHEVRLRAAQVSAHIKLMLYGISELQNRNNSDGSST
ncbi:protein UXT homolog [Bombyx mandarina]|uniref:Protein UXT homolog n=1 Tax=Bombyx mandarina TaxID=7092 RepID=A0A6J2JYS3_BOMMA|nr:protein UXT homolog [Bombyx mandarina]